MQYAEPVSPFSGEVYRPVWRYCTKNDDRGGTMAKIGELIPREQIKAPVAGKLQEALFHGKRYFTANGTKYRIEENGVVPVKRQRR